MHIEPRGVTCVQNLRRDRFEMYDTEALAIRVADSAASMMRISGIGDVQDSLLMNLAIAGVMREAGYIHRGLRNSNSAIRSLIGTSESNRPVSMTYSEIADILCSDDVLDRAVVILRDLRQNRWRPYRNLPRNQQRNQFRENYIRRSPRHGVWTHKIQKLYQCLRNYLNYFQMQNIY